MASINRSTATNPIGMRYTPRDIVGGYAELVRERMDDGFEPTFLSFMFNPLHGSPAAVSYQMRFEVERVYAWMLTHRCRRPKKTPNHRMPLLIACPDWPVPKYQKSSLRDVTVNNGLHLHGFDLTPPETRLVCTLSDFIADHQEQLAGEDRPLARIYAETFRSSPEEVVDYVLKSLPRGRADSDDLIVLPRSSNEVHHRDQF